MNTNPRLRLNIDAQLKEFIRSEAALADTTMHAVVVRILREAHDARHREAL